ncbi:MAG: hypothetical protein WCO45_02725 [Pseudanabaena sp. ELA607]|jgi:hypothetical protein
MNIKRNTLGFGLSVAVLGAMGAAVAPQAEAATVYARNGAFSFGGKWQFDYMHYDYANTPGNVIEGTSYGSYRSSFGVTPPANASAIIIEKNGAVPGDCKPGKCSGVVNFAINNSLAQFFYQNHANASDTANFFGVITSGTNSSYVTPRPASGGYPGFLILTKANYTTVAQMPGTYLKSSTDGALYNKRLLDTANVFFSKASNKNAVLIGVNDSFNGDTDFQDMIVSARAVPMPLLAPGLAVAGAFFAYRRKRQTAV